MTRSVLIQKVRNFCHILRDEGVGYGDHAGSGLPKIYRNWQGQHWRRPLLYELAEPEQTLMELRMTSLVPDEAVVELEAHLGAAFRAMQELERLALVTAVTEGMVNHTRLREISTEHPADITKQLAHLVKEGFLVSDGVGRGMVYYVPWKARPLTSDLFSTELLTQTMSKTQELFTLPQEIDPKRQELDPKRQELDPKRQELGLPVWADRSQIPDDEWQRLETIALPVRTRGKVSPSTMQTVIRQLCRGQFIGLLILAELLGRNKEHLRNRILNEMVREQCLRRAYPRPNDPRQAYTTNLQTDEETEA